MTSVTLVHWVATLQRYPQWGFGFIGTGLLLATFITYTTGGTHNVFPHLFYVPVVMAAFFFRVHGGLVVGVMAGLLSGPWMPLDVEAGLSQPPTGWTLRMMFFVSIGALSGALRAALHQRILDLEQLNGQAVFAFVRTIDSRSPYTARHSERVAEFAVGIARHLNLTSDEVRRVYWAGLLHDVGKLALPDQILNKEGSLTQEEWALIKEHPAASVRILEGVDQFKAYIPGVRHHHERMDGKGYPDKISGASIPLEGRILAVADAFEAMTADRPYRSGMPEEEAVKRLVKSAGTQFDPHIVEGFLRMRGAHASWGKAMGSDAAQG